MVSQIYVGIGSATAADIVDDVVLTLGAGAMNIKAVSKQVALIVEDIHKAFLINVPCGKVR